MIRIRPSLIIRSGLALTTSLRPSPFSFRALAPLGRRAMGSNPPPTGPIRFGPFEVTTQVFLTTPHSFALVNLKPLLPGHVLVCPLRPHLRLTDLSPPELTDLFLTVQRVQRMLARHYFSSSASSSSSSSSTATATATAAAAAAAAEAEPKDGSFNIAIQDGSGAGQTVSHVHVHVIPRVPASTAFVAANGTGDQLYEDMAGEKGNVGGALWDRDRRAEEEMSGREEEEAATRPVPGGAFARIEDAERRPRGMREMEEEAGVFRSVLEEMGE